jgi:hypothetical protein
MWPFKTISRIARAVPFISERKPAEVESAPIGYCFTGGNTASFEESK